MQFPPCGFKGLSAFEDSLYWIEDLTQQLTAPDTVPMSMCEMLARSPRGPLEVVGDQTGRTRSDPLEELIGTNLALRPEEGSA